MSQYSNGRHNSGNIREKYLNFLEKNKNDNRNNISTKVCDKAVKLVISRIGENNFLRLSYFACSGQEYKLIPANKDADCVQPIFSPSGSKVLYREIVNGVSKIAIVDLSNTQAVQVSGNDKSYFNPDWINDYSVICMDEYNNWKLIHTNCNVSSGAVIFDNAIFQKSINGENAIALRRNIKMQGYDVLVNKVGSAQHKIITAKNVSVGNIAKETVFFSARSCSGNFMRIYMFDFMKHKLRKEAEYYYNDKLNNYYFDYCDNIQALAYCIGHGYNTKIMVKINNTNYQKILMGQNEVRAIKWSKNGEILSIRDDNGIKMFALSFGLINFIGKVWLPLSLKNSLDMRCYDIY